MQKRNTLATLAAAAVIILILTVLADLGALRPVLSLLQRGLAPVARLAYRTGSLFHSRANDGLSQAELQDKLKAAEAENRKLLADNIRLAQLEQENATLRQRLDFFSVTNFSHVIAAVTSRGQVGDSWRQHSTLTLDRGAKDGLRPGQPIVDGQGALLGKITATTDHAAEACLLFDADCRVAVSLQGQPGTAGVIQSDLNLAIKADFIPQNMKIAEGQVMLTAGLESGMPAGLLVGKVSRIVSEGNELWQHAIISPLADFDDLSIVSVIK